MHWLRLVYDMIPLKRFAIWSEGTPTVCTTRLYHLLQKIAIKLYAEKKDNREFFKCPTMRCKRFHYILMFVTVITNSKLSMHYPKIKYINYKNYHKYQNYEVMQKYSLREPEILELHSCPHVPSYRPHTNRWFLYKKIVIRTLIHMHMC